MFRLRMQTAAIGRAPQGAWGLKFCKPFAEFLLYNGAPHKGRVG